VSEQRTTTCPGILLPSPVDRPRTDVVLYDGHCRICRGQIERLSRWDRRGRLSYLSLHDPLVAQRYPDLTHARLMREMVVVDRGGRYHGGAEALRYLSRRLPLLRWLAPLLYLPGTLPLWRFLYRQVASRRYRLGTIDSACADGSCHLHGSSGKRPAAKE